MITRYSDCFFIEFYEYNLIRLIAGKIETLHQYLNIDFNLRKTAHKFTLKLFVTIKH